MSVLYKSFINKTKGTLQGLMTELSALTGYSANLWIGPNLMLSNDQSFFEDPVPGDWSPYLNYNVNELITYNDYIYIYISSPNYGQAPSGTTSPNSWWQVQQAVTSTVLNNSVTGGVDTWEGIYNLTPNTTLPAGGLTEVIGVQDPISTLHNNANALQIKNVNTSTSDMWIRSVSRTPSVMAQLYADQYQAIADGIPVPSILTAKEWNSTTIYYPQEIVLYNNQPFMALRTSQNSVPPYTSPGTNSLDWEPLNYNDRFRIVSSAYIKGSSLTVVPFIEWYDSSGNFITRVFAKNNGTQPSKPNGVAFDSFITGVGQQLSTYTSLDDRVYNWTVATGNFTISPYANGCAYPSSQSTRSIATVNTGSANAQAGITFITTPTSEWVTGLILRYASSTSYLEATMTELVENNAGTFSVIGNYSTPCVAGDRLVVTLNGNIITAYRNGVSVLSTSSSFNNTATSFGIAYEQLTGLTSPDMYTSTYGASYGS
jgi:hypothetical protein